MVQRFYIGSRLGLGVGSEVGEGFPVKVVLRQSGLMSPWQFIVYILLLDELVMLPMG